jgi:hypothetical protein
LEVAEIVGMGNENGMEIFVEMFLIGMGVEKVNGMGEEFSRIHIKFL